ncbi:MAG: hypothetical protein JNN12_01345 [Bacteroidetes Order II. Incertae sedis bacterium]|nr:hypothetical protein [Bacteroidetes Order II. bacterium]
MPSHSQYSGLGKLLHMAPPAACAAPFTGGGVAFGSAFPFGLGTLGRFSVVDASAGRTEVFTTSNTSNVKFE